MNDLGLVTEKSDDPVGVGMISIALGEARATVEYFYESYLLQSGLVQRINRVRVAIIRACGHLGMPLPR